MRLFVMGVALQDHGRARTVTRLPEAEDLGGMEGTVLVLVVVAAALLVTGVELPATLEDKLNWGGCEGALVALGVAPPGPGMLRSQGFRGVAITSRQSSPTSNSAASVLKFKVKGGVEWGQDY
jgi:hypothetical protein